ncbi:MAG: hypothetical protein JSW60_01625 [Thermoplasmatales archaeon]|nr:MAG: hypothetical protein JSW60_01625 [Thermoplasmatales archaeon]
MIKSNTFGKRIELKIALYVIVTFSVILPTGIVEAEYQRDSLQKSLELEIEQQIFYNYGWRQLTGNGFGKETNLATRGMAIYNDELYIGTQNAKLPKVFQNTFPKLLLKLSQLLPNKLPKFLQRTLLFKTIFRLVHFLRGCTFRRGLHLVVRPSEGCEIWKYNYTTDSLIQVVGNSSITGMKAGFDYNFNCLATVITEFKGKLYVGTWNTPIGSLQDPRRKGAEIWRYDGTTWEQVVGHNAPLVKGGFGNFNNAGISSMEEFNGYLFAGTMNWGSPLHGGCEIWRTRDGVQWEQVVARGFKQNMSTADLVKGVTNTYVWSMKVFQNQLYAGTFNSRYRFIFNAGMGCQLWRTSCGRNWSKVSLPTGRYGVYQDGFGEPENYGTRTMAVYNNELYVGTASNLILNKGCEIWKYDGVNWMPVISADVPGVKPTDVKYSGFGNPLNKYAWSMIVTSDNKLYVGTANGKIINLIEPKTNGCEIWCYNGTEWIPVVKDGKGEKPNGFGNIKNEGARSMIEYPRGSGNLVVGTFKLISTRPLMPREGCDLWMRIT